MADDEVRFDACPECGGRAVGCRGCYGEGTGPGQGRTWRSLEVSSLRALWVIALVVGLVSAGIVCIILGSRP